MIPATLAPAAAPAVAEPPARPASPWPVFWVASVAIFLVSLDGTMLYSVFGALREGFPGASAADMSWVLNAYTVVYAAMLIPAGGLADTHGRKRVFLLGVTLFVAASALCGLASSVGWLIAARVLQAVGAALLTPASLSIVLAAYAASKSAAWSLTNALRHELAAQRTQVLALHMAFVDTDLVRALEGPKTSADEIVARALDALEDGLDEVLADERTRAVKQGLTAARPSYLPQAA